MRGNIYIYIMVMAVVTFLIRVLPLTLIKKEIKNKWVKSFLYYVPYVTLAVMTFPAIIDVTGNAWSGVLALVTGIVVAYFGASLPVVAVLSCLMVFVGELIIL